VNIGNYRSCTEAEGRFNYLGMVSNNTNYKTEEIKATITAAYKDYSLCILSLDVIIFIEIIKYKHIQHH